MAVAEAKRSPRRVSLDLPVMLLLVVLCALWGAQQVSVKLAVAGGVAPTLQGVLRSAIAVGCLCLWTGLREGGAGLRPFWPRGAALLPAAVTALVFGLEFVALYEGLSLTTASRGVLFLYTAPFFTAAGAHVFVPGERLRRRPFLGLVVAFAGVATVFARGAAAPGASLPGDALCLFSGFTWAVNTVLVKASPALRVASPGAVLVYQLGGGWPVMLLGCAALGELSWPHATALAWASLLYQSVVVAFASYLAWFWLVLRYPAGLVSGFTFLTPLFGILAGWLVLGERVGPELLLGVACVAIGLRLLNVPGPHWRGPLPDAN